MKLGLHLSLVLIIVLCWLNVTNSSIQKKGTTSNDKRSAIAEKQTDKPSLRSQIQKFKTAIADKLAQHTPLNGKEKRFLKKLMARKQQQRNASSTEGEDYGISFGFADIFRTDSFVGDLLSLESEEYGFDTLDWSAIFDSYEYDYDEGSEELDGLGTSEEIKRMFRKWNKFTLRSEHINLGEDDITITPGDGPTIHPEDLPKLKKTAEKFLIQSATLDTKVRNPWVQISNDSIDQARVTTLELTMLAFWQKGLKIDCGLKDNMAKCAKALNEIDEFVNIASDGTDYALDMDYFNRADNKDNYCKKKVTKCQDLEFSNINGWCNNLNNPDWGGKNIPYRRLLKHNFYKEHISEVIVF
jgi:hypothetical protein